MARKPPDPTEPKRLRRTVSVAEALQGVLDPALRKRGFASRDLITHWAAMAPKPYDVATLPDRLAWPRGARGAEGATLYLRCAPAQALALSHEGQLVAAAINRYFGYVLVNSVRLSLEPFKPEPSVKPPVPTTSPEVARQSAEAVEAVGDEGIREALRGLGEGVLARKPRKSVTKP